MIATILTNACCNQGLTMGLGIGSGMIGGIYKIKREVPKSRI